MVGAIPIINVMATLVFMPVVFASEVINSIDYIKMIKFK